MSVINYEQAYAYMRVGVASPELVIIMREMERELLAMSTPRKLAKVYDAVKVDNNYLLKGTEIVLESEYINKLFVEVEQIAVQCVTLGITVDKRIEYYARMSGIRMLALDALANVYIEQLADELSAEIAKKHPDMHMTVRFSPGYRDLSLDVQPKIIAELDATKRAGVSLNSSNLMIPLKSITGFSGFSKQSQPQSFDCNKCLSKDCGGSNCPRRII